MQNVENSNDCKEHNENLNILEVEDLNSPPNLKEHISHASKYQARNYVKKVKEISQLTRLFKNREYTSIHRVWLYTLVAV